MSSNLKANISLTTNILLVIGTFLLVLNLAPINRKARIEQLCTEFNYLRGHQFHRAIPYDGINKESNPKLTRVQKKRVKRRIYLDKKITRMINLPYFTSKKEKDKTGYEGEAFRFCELYNHEFFNIYKYDYKPFNPNNKREFRYDQRKMYVE